MEEKGPEAGAIDAVLTASSTLLSSAEAALVPAMLLIVSCANIRSCGF